MSGDVTIFEKIKKSVVLIHAQTNLQEIPFMNGEYVQQDGVILSKGTGFICSPDGLIITAEHVVGDAAGDIIVQRQDEEKTITYKAKLLYLHKDSDTALLKIDETNLPFANLGDYATSKEGEDIGFIGFPLSFGIPIIHKGIIAAKTRTPFAPEKSPIDIFIINSFVNPGNSGGPLFKIFGGEVIGLINSRLSANSYREQEFMELPENYQPIVQIGGIDPIKLSVDTYNKNLAYIGEVAQLGIGISASIEYAKDMIKKYRDENASTD